MGKCNPPPTHWRQELKGCNRAWHWQRAGGFNADGSDKSNSAHRTARTRVRINEAIRLIGRKEESEKTSKDRDLVLKTDIAVEKHRLNASSNHTAHKEAVKETEAKCEEDRTSLESDLLLKDKARKMHKFTTDKARNTDPEVSKKRRQAQLIYTALPEVIKRRKEVGKIYLAIPENHAKKLIQAANNNAIQKVIIQEKKAAVVEEFILNTGIDITTVPLSDAHAFNYIMDLMEDTDSVIGKAIFDALGGMTLRTAFWDGEFNGAMYALISRGAADVGGCHAEAIRFLLNNKCGSSTVLTRADNGERFRYTDQEFKDLELVYCPIRVCNNYADVTTMESAFQLLFDYLEVGRHRLWLRSGNGYSKLILRKVDMKYIKDTNDDNPKFMFGITILKKVSVVERTTDSNGKDVVVSITGGLGTKCRVNQPLRSAPICNESQREALAAAQATLGPNFRDRSRKRKAAVLDE